MRFKQPLKTVQSSKTRKSIMISWFFASWGHTFLAQCTAESGCFGRGEGVGAGACARGAQEGKRRVSAQIQNLSIKIPGRKFSLPGINI